MEKILKEVDPIVVFRKEANFDRACDAAWSRAMHDPEFGIDEFGHSSKLEEWDRCDSYIEIEFQKYNRTGDWHHYSFTAKAVKNIE